MFLTGILLISLTFATVLYLCCDVALWLAAIICAVSYAVLVALAFLILWLCCKTVDMEKPQEEDSPIWRAVMHLYIEALISLVGVRLHTKGLENTPREGRFVLVCNHLFIADPGIILHCFKKSQLAFVTKQENQKLPLVGPIMHKILCQPIDRENDRAALKTILKCISLIKEDKCSMCVFPEGYTSKDGKLHPFRAGVFKIAQKANVPIVVCTIRNTRPIFKNLKKLKKTDVYLNLVGIIPSEEVKGLSTVELSDRIYACMIADLGEDFRI